jgi:cytochrome c55X
MRDSRVLLMTVAMLIPMAAGAEIGSRRQAELRHLLHQDCGACHGLHLTGGLGPPLTPASLAGKPAPDLAAAIRQGRPGTPMPPWADFLSAEEARWLVDVMKSGAGEADTGQ